MRRLLVAGMTVSLLGAGCTDASLGGNLGANTLPHQTQNANLTNQGLTKFPVNVLSETGLETLDISHNQLTGTMPAEIRQLTSLRELDASDNKLTGVPAEIGQLTNLEVLDLSNNQLTGLPHELGNLSKLTVLDLSGNDVSPQDLDVIRAALPASVDIRL